VILLHEASTRAQLFRMLSSAPWSTSPDWKVCVVVRIFDYLHRLAPVRADVRLMVGHQQMNDRLA
jgi:hypothetical protein